MKTELTMTRYNITALIGWATVVVGLVSGGFHIFGQSESELGIILFAIGLVGGGITVTLAGRVKTTTTRVVDVQPISDRDKH